MRQFSRKALVAGGLVATLGLGGIAFAFFTTTGSGNGSATVGTSSALVLHGSAPTLLYPGTSSSVCVHGRTTLIRSSSSSERSTWTA